MTPRTAVFFLIWAMALNSCALFRGPSGIDVPLLIRRAQGDEIPETESLDTRKFSHPEVRPDLKHLCMGWPLKGTRISSPFGRRFGRRHKGLDLKAVTGTPVLAVLPGKVIYADDGVRGYGKLVLIQHPRRLATVYAHLSEIQVESQQWIQRGEVIGRAGETGNATGPHLHFEVRDEEEATNPLRFLSVYHSRANVSCEEPAPLGEPPHPR